MATTKCTKEIKFGIPTKMVSYALDTKPYNNLQRVLCNAVKSVEKLQADKSI